MDAGDTATIASGGIAAAKGNGAAVDIAAVDQTIVDFGGSVQAGIEFQGDPVSAVQVSDATDVTLTAGSELIIYGNVNTSGQMTLTSGAPTNDVSQYFDHLEPEEYLYGTTQVSLLIGGTLRSTATDSLLDLSAPGPIVLSGIIEAGGTGSDLMIKSDDWIYLDSHITVEDSARIYGGYDSSLQPTGNADAHGASVYLDKLTVLNTLAAGSSIDIRGSQDVDLWGNVVSGGTVGAGGVTFSGPGSSISLTAGEQVYLATGLQAADTVLVTGGTPGLEDLDLSVVVDTRGGIYSAGLSLDGQGGHVEIQSPGNLEIMGHVVSGANVELEYDDNNNFISRTFLWSAELSDVLISAGGQAFIGGNTQNTSGEAIQTGGYIYAQDRIEINGGTHSTSVGTLVHAASEIVTHGADSAIEINATRTL